MHVAAGGWNGSATLAFTGEATIIVKRRRPTIPHPFSSHHFTLEFSSPLRPRSCPAVDDDLAPSARSLGLKPPSRHPDCAPAFKVNSNTLDATKMALTRVDQTGDLNVLLGNWR